MSDDPSKAHSVLHFFARRLAHIYHLADQLLPILRHLENLTSKNYLKHLTGTNPSSERTSSAFPNDPSPTCRGGVRICYLADCAWQRLLDFGIALEVQRRQVCLKHMIKQTALHFALHSEAVSMFP